MTTALALVALLLAGGALGMAWRERSERRAAERAAAEARERAVEAGRRRERIERRYGDLREREAEALDAARLRSLRQLVRGFVHEINTPLGALHGNHGTIRRALARLQDILADERVDEDELDEVRRIVRAVDGVQETNDLAVERIRHVVRDLEAFGRPEAAEVDVVDLREALEGTLRLVSADLGGIEVVRDYGVLPRVRCRPHRLSQAFLNLVTNACQAMDGEGTLTVRTRAGPDRGAEAGTRAGSATGAGTAGTVTVTVADTGVGIPPEHRERIFEPGFSTKGERVGMGLGLLITRQIVEEHGGRIAVESTPGEGSAFSVTLPVDGAGLEGGRETEETTADREEP